MKKYKKIYMITIQVALLIALVGIAVMIFNYETIIANQKETISDIKNVAKEEVEEWENKYNMLEIRCIELESLPK